MTGSSNFEPHEAYLELVPPKSNDDVSLTAFLCRSTFAITTSSLLPPAPHSRPQRGIKPIRNRVRKPHELTTRLQRGQHPFVAGCLSRSLHEAIDQSRDPKDHVHDGVCVEKQHAFDFAFHFAGLAALGKFGGGGFVGGGWVEVGFVAGMMMMMATLRVAWRMGVQGTTTIWRWHGGSAGVEVVMFSSMMMDILPVFVIIVVFVVVGLFGVGKWSRFFGGCSRCI